jgi:L-lactate dehydrogenase (cytochrome)
MGLHIQVDSAGIGKRETDLRLTPGGSAPRSKSTKRRWADDLTWDDIPWFRSFTKMPIILKGVQCAADAILAYENGLEGIVVSNHGGRNMDTARPSLEVLIEVMAALRAKDYKPAKFQVGA